MRSLIDVLRTYRIYHKTSQNVLLIFIQASQKNQWIQIFMSLNGVIRYWVDKCNWSCNMHPSLTAFILSVRLF